MARRSFRLTYPCAVAAAVAIVGGAPSSSGITGCAAPLAQAPQSAARAPNASMSGERAPLAPPSGVAVNETAKPPPAAAIQEPATAPSSTSSSSPAPPSSSIPVHAPPAHVWRRGELQEPLSELSSWVKKNGGQLSAEVVDVTSGAALGGVAATTPENPASNQKIVTTAAVLRQFGIGFRFKTALCGKRAGGLVPTLVLRGAGDPSLSSADLRALAHALSLSGVNQVGQLVLDQSFFDARFVPPAFEQQPEEWAAFRAPVSALSLDRNVTTLNVAPTALGQAAKVWFDPEGFVDVTGRVLTKPVGRERKGAGSPRRAEQAEGQARGERAENVKLTLQASGARLAALVGGEIAPNSPAFHWSRRVEDPSLLAGYGFKSALAAEGIQLLGQVALAGAADAGGECAELAAHESLPLAELLPALGKDSDNFFAETLMKDLGARVRGRPGTSESGAAAELEYLRSIDALDAGTRITNGSGLFDANRLSAHSLALTLRHASLEPATGRAFVEQLAIGGVDGTLKHRFGAFKKLRSIRAKTGTLDRVIALSGFALRPDGSSPVAFSLIVSGIANHAEVRKRVDAVVTRIANRLAEDAAKDAT